MQLFLVVAFIPIVNTLWSGGASANNCILADLFLQFGYSRECVVSSLASIVLRNKVPTTNEPSLAEDLVLKVKNSTNTLTEVQTLLQENVTSILTEVKTLLQVVKSELKNVSNFQSEIEALLQEMKSERENSVSEIKTLLQELKTEQQNEKKAIAKLEAKINSTMLKNCADLKVQGETSSGVQTVYPYGSLNPKSTTVYCDQATDGGGWTVIQSRSPLPIRENFQRNWTEYVEGFGDIKGEFWLGLDNIHALTNSGKMELRVDLEDAEGEKRFAKYRTFHVGDAASKYVLRISNYSGDAGDGMTYAKDKYYNSNNMKFSTFDNDNDLFSGYNCAELYKGGWWFDRCSVAQLNGLPIVGSAPNGDGILWGPFHGWNHSMKKASVKIRPVCLDF